jgi:nitrite reductase/ring-hydroxylating ferredoxin subunit
MTQAWHDAAAFADIADNAALGVSVNGLAIALFRIDGEVFALRDQCPHGKGLLSEGVVENGCVECPLHQGLVDIRSGAPRGAPITVAARRYGARIVDGRVEIAL